MLAAFFNGFIKLENILVFTHDQVETTTKANSGGGNSKQKDLSISKYSESKHFTGSTIRSQPRAPLETTHLPFLLHPAQKRNLNGEKVTD